MPLSGCIDQSTLARICDFELFKPETDVTESEWPEYFLSARQSDHTTYKKLETAMSSLCMDTSLQDAESRMSRLMADFFSILNGLNMIQLDPKKVLSYLADALRPGAFKCAVKDQLGRPAHKLTRSNLQVFLKWVRTELEGFMRFEVHISAVNSHNGGNKISFKLTQETAPLATGKSNGAKSDTVQHTRPVNTSQSKAPAARPVAKSATKRAGESGDRACFKCGDLTHGVFQCPNVGSSLEAKELNEKRSDRKVSKAVVSMASTAKRTTQKLPSIPCVVMDAVEIAITPDSGAEVTVVTSRLLAELKERGVWFSYQNLPQNAAVAGISEKTLSVRTKVKLDCAFQLQVVRWCYKTWFAGLQLKDYRKDSVIYCYLAP